VVGAWVHRDTAPDLKFKRNVTSPAARLTVRSATTKKSESFGPRKKIHRVQHRTALLHSDRAKNQRQVRTLDRITAYQHILARLVRGQEKTSRDQTTGGPLAQTSKNRAQTTKNQKKKKTQTRRQTAKRLGPKPRKARLSKVEIHKPLPYKPQPTVHYTLAHKNTGDKNKSIARTQN